MPKVSINSGAFDRNRKANIFAVYNCAVDIQMSSQNRHGFDPSEYLVFSVVSCANMQRAFRQLAHSDFHSDDLAPARGRDVPISRRRIAEATGLPRETVRRIVQKLILRGYLIESDGRQILVPQDIAEGDQDPRDVMAPILRMVQTLMATGVIQLE
ncbi:helix-turn-helix domain-containing protein [Sphingomonas montanisoli]|uniref:Helix-turn-helix domain-containing protein n=1 Tax=Sphingomonas montanisoli TaxID=2606412 RepID=A0A5D9C0W1_9SPHN|nr:winged helix-turn-helix transcriptional regulator [Sphingomonas montanisoli]TZG24922.1 helix-turn-helix domain-containing protein [Sphingomonas montanisoli]